VTLFYVCRRDSKECKDCGFCTEYFSCPGVGKPSIERFETACIDCSVCYIACPYRAVERIEDVVPRKRITIVVDDEYFAVPERTTVKRALESLGLEFGKFPNGTKIFTPCETGGCFTCAVQIDGKPKPAVWSCQRIMFRYVGFRGFSRIRSVVSAHLGGSRRVVNALWRLRASLTAVI